MRSFSRWLITILVIVVLVLAAVWLFQEVDDDPLDDAADEIEDTVDDIGDSIDPNRLQHYR